MSGRGKSILIRTSSTPSVTIGLTLSTSPSQLSLSSLSTNSFYVVVTARVIKTPRPGQCITLAKRLSPLASLENRSFADIICSNNSEKKIEIYPINWPHFFFDMNNLREDWEFVTIPPPGKGVFTTQLEVPRDKLEAVDLMEGERYHITLTDKCLGTFWWCYGSLTDLEGIRLRQWESQEDRARERQYEASWKLDEEERIQKYGKGPVSFGEEPQMLAMVPEGEGVEFEVVK
ncbi:hypothetical protein BT63DRAFT_481917 [Microthyrium microscopicum]|uniref:Uncharacterized protein n=1 Tax=Microthyrium microscopicum TaxID=703497 RepID=A0A6A6U3V2_9PEZI|nr:hypothetical protein BT63DRAFT_481917 [Microthyrium microscopicum]